MSHEYANVCIALRPKSGKEAIGIAVPVRWTDKAMFYPSDTRGRPLDAAPALVCRDTIRPCSGLRDENGAHLCCGDRVTFLGHPGVVSREYGAFGIAFPDGVDRKAMIARLPRAIGTATEACLFANDNFVPFWAVVWCLGDVADDSDVVPYVRLADA